MILHGHIPDVHVFCLPYPSHWIFFRAQRDTVCDIILQTIKYDKNVMALLETTEHQKLIRFSNISQIYIDSFFLGLETTTLVQIHLFSSQVNQIIRQSQRAAVCDILLRNLEKILGEFVSTEHWTWGVLSKKTQTCLLRRYVKNGYGQAIQIISLTSPILY